MKRKNKLIFIVAFIAIVTVSSLFFSTILNKPNEYAEEELINISDLSDEFMQNYFSEMDELDDQNKENILIVTSKERIKDTEASKIIEAPNNQYVLQYDSGEQKQKALKRFSNNKKIISVEENNIYMPTEISETAYNSWGIEVMGLDNALEISKNKDLNDVTVAVIDSGCDMDLFNNHYEGRILEAINLINTEAKITDETGHGTHIAGTIAESTPENVKILPIKVGTDGGFYNSEILEAINYIIYYKKADLINMSFGSNFYNTSIHNAIKTANEKNIISVAAAGNDSTATAHYPSSYEETMSISAIGDNLNIASFSNYGSSITFAAPGVNILSINGYKSGTSMATPHAVSALAILKSYNKNLSLDDTIEILKTYSKDLGTKGYDRYYGNGLISLDNIPFEKCSSNICDKEVLLDISKKPAIVNIEVGNIIFTPYNYGSLTNLGLIELKLIYSDGNAEKFKVGDFDDIEIFNYNPYSTEEQTIQIKYENITTGLKLKNPDSYELGWEYTKIGEQNIEITNYKDHRSDILKLYVPETINGYNVISFADSTTTKSKVFGNSVDIFNYTEIILPKTLTKIGSYTFYGTSNLEKVISLSENLEIGKYAFGNSESLKTINGNITSLGTSAFRDCVSLENISLSEQITVIPSYAFYGCINLENIQIPKNVIQIDSYAFYDTNIKTIEIPKGVEKINSYSFANCVNLENLTLVEGLIEIESSAFSYTNIRSLYIPKTVTRIVNTAFREVSSLESIVVDEENPVYDSRNNSNAIINTETNTLVIGTYNTIIPNTIETIGRGAFYKNLKLTKIKIPSSVKVISSNAFYGCIYLEEVVLHNGISEIGASAFKGNDDLILWVYSDSYAKTYAVKNSLNYRHIDPNRASIHLSKKEYKAFETVDTKGMYMTLFYDEKTTRQEIVETGLSISYPNNNQSFRYGDTHFIVSGKNNRGYSFKCEISVTISKAIPQYVVPANLTAKIGQKLSEIVLPEGFEWMNPDEIINDEGNRVFKAKYTPVDTENYEIVENIEINILVNNPKEIVEPNIVISDKIYDGSTTISIDSIIISNLEKSEYSIESVTSLNIEVGNGKATIKIKLTDDKFKNYSFSDNKQEKEFIVDFKIIPCKVEKPSLKQVSYIYNGLEQTAEINNYQEDKMNVKGNKRTNAGEQEITISLKNNNYIWNDNSSNDVILKFKIDKANPNIKYISSGQNVKYDGKAYGINLEVQSPKNVTIKYMDDSGEYTLNEMPKYSQTGTYTIKFKLFIDDNYIEIFDEEVLIITKNIIKNNTVDFETIYDGKEHSIYIDIELENYNIKYSINNLDYNLTELPKFTEVGEYTINYKISSDLHEDIYGSNKVKIYGIKKFDSKLILKDNILILKDKNNIFSNLSSKINVFANSYLFNHYDKNKKLINSELLRTGDMIGIKINNSKEYQYPISILGDVTGDGIINIADVIKIADHTITQNVLSTQYNKLAADVTGDNIINIADVVKIADYTLNNNINLWR